MEKLWTLKDVANYLGVAYAVACTYSKGGSFPKAIRLPNGRHRQVSVKKEPPERLARRG